MNVHINSSELSNPLLHYSYRSGHYQIPVKEILYIESRERKCYIYTNKRTKPHVSNFFEENDSKDLCFYGKLSELTDILIPYGFVRCHQSFLVSVTAKTHYKNNHLYVNNKEIPVSERYRRTIIDLFDKPQISDNKHKLRYTIGAMVCIKGEYLGSVIRMYPNVICKIGRDNQSSEIIINLPYISRSHCDIRYNGIDTYEIKDYSHNGTYIIKENGTAEKLTPAKIYTASSGSVICFGDISLQYRLI